MDSEKLKHSLKSGQFKKVTNSGEKFERGACIYAKEINPDVYLLFVIIDNQNANKIYATIANYDKIDDIGVIDSKKVLFHLNIESKEDFHHLEKYVNVLV